MFQIGNFKTGWWSVCAFAVIIPRLSLYHMNSNRLVDFLPRFDTIYFAALTSVQSVVLRIIAQTLGHRRHADIFGGSDLLLV